MNADKLPQEATNILRAHVLILREALCSKLIGVYVHGSAALGGFNPAQSDLDYLVLISSPLTNSERRALSISFLQIYGEDAPAKGVEMSIVHERFAGKHFQYPTPYEFYMGSPEQVRFYGQPRDSTHVETDKDLAAHFMITKMRGLCVYGQPIDDVFEVVAREYYLDSIATDSERSFTNILKKTGSQECVVPMYAVLNFCRVLAFVDDGLITSKIEGGKWGIKILPNKFYPIILSGLLEYSHPGSSEKVDPFLLKDFAEYAQTKIRKAWGKPV
jgi:predicted nucleotidyltransferase